MYQYIASGFNKLDILFRTIILKRVICVILLNYFALSRIQKHKSECSKKPPLCRICKKEYTEDIDDHMRNSCVASCPFGCNVVSAVEIVLPQINLEVI